MNKHFWVVNAAHPHEQGRAYQLPPHVLVFEADDTICDAPCMPCRVCRFLVFAYFFPPGFPGDSPRALLTAPSQHPAITQPTTRTPIAEFADFAEFAYFCSSGGSWGFFKCPPNDTPSAPCNHPFTTTP